MEYKKVKVADLITYENNPRINDGAVEAVMESISQCTYLTPIIVDENMVILSGHTRKLALEQLGETECEVGIAAGLTEEQKKKYRLLDNKTNELAAWDFEKLEEELEGLDFDGFDFGFDKEMSYMDDLMENEFGHESSISDEFQLTFRFKKDDETAIKDFIKKMGNDYIVDMITREAINNA